METRLRKITARGSKDIMIGVIPGHFATNHSHVNYYIDMTALKSHCHMAKSAAAKLASNYLTSTPVDTIVCLEGTQMLGAFLANELTQAGMRNINSKHDICVVTPELNANNQMIFRDNTQKMIWNKNILFLISSASTGKTIRRSLDCLQYYNGKLVGIAAIFSAIKESDGVSVHSIFDVDDLPDYKTYLPPECPQCAENKKIDAIVNSYGYSKI